MEEHAQQASRVKERLQQLDSVSAPPTWELVASELRRKIKDGSYLPYDHLPPERELATTLGVSRPKVREALLLLSGEGLLEMTSRGTSGGPLVKPLPTPSEDHIRKELRQTLPHLLDILDCRKALECFGASEAARNRSEEHVTDLGESVNAVKKVVEALQALTASEGAESMDEEVVVKRAQETAKFRRADSAFHRTVAEATGNECLRELIDDLRTELFTNVTVAVLFGSSDDPGVQDEIPQDAFRRHSEILEAIRRKDGPAAAAAMGDHVDFIKKSLKGEV